MLSAAGLWWDKRLSRGGFFACRRWIEKQKGYCWVLFVCIYKVQCKIGGLYCGYLGKMCVKFLRWGGVAKKSVYRGGCFVVWKVFDKNRQKGTLLCIVCVYTYGIMQDRRFVLWSPWERGGVEFLCGGRGT